MPGPLSGTARTIPQRGSKLLELPPPPPTSVGWTWPSLDPGDGVSLIAAMKRNYKTATKREGARPAQSRRPSPPPVYAPGANGRTNVLSSIGAQMFVRASSCTSMRYALPSSQVFSTLPSTKEP